MPTPQEYGLTPTATGCRLAVQVAPRSSANRVLGPHGGALKVALTAPPVAGAANAALVAYLAGVLGVPRRQVQLVAGATRRAKMVEINGLTPAEALARLAP
jgi:uncharacterized protein (TIGR00251 family)